VTEGVTGAGVVGVRIALLCPNCVGRRVTDSTGHYRLSPIRAGSYRIAFHCPSQTLLGAEILKREVTVAAGREDVINVRVPPRLCDEPSYSERAGIFRGYWTPGFESSAFVPCADSVLGVSAPLLPGKRVYPPTAWASLTDSVKMPKTRGAPPRVDNWGNATYFVIWHGVLKGPGSYGHLGVSEFSMIVDSVIAVRGRGPASCRTR
jgi:hypothetical protein